MKKKQDIPPEDNLARLSNNMVTLANLLLTIRKAIVTGAATIGDAHDTLQLLHMQSHSDKANDQTVEKPNTSEKPAQKPPGGPYQPPPPR